MKSKRIQVDGVQLLTDLSDLLSQYVSFHAHAEDKNIEPDAIALWTLFTHTIDAFYVAPFLAILSPERRCGKTRLLEMLEHVTRNGEIIGNMTPAMVYRINGLKNTMLIDEGDTFIVQGNQSNEGMRGILNIAHTRRAKVYRGDSDTYKPKSFSPFGAKAIAMIGELQDTLEDRSIKIRMERKRPDEVVARYRVDRMQHADEIRMRCEQWAKENVKDLKELDPRMPKGLHDRAEDNWRPLIAIADQCGNKWRGRARHVARVLEGANGSGLTVNEQLLADAHEIANGGAGDYIGSSELLAQLAALDRWSAFNDDGSPLTPTSLGKTLRSFGIASERFRAAAVTERGNETVKRQRGFSRDLLKKAHDRYVSEALEEDV
jgi:putative DNA primase/helicase